MFAENVIPIVIGPKARHPWLYYLWFEFQLPRIFKKYKIDLFYSPESFLSLKSKVPTLMVTHDLAFETYKDHLPAYQQKYNQKYGPLFHERADHIVAVSEFTKQDIIQKYGASSNKISVAGNASPSGFKPMRQDNIQSYRNKYSMGKPYILYVGSVHPRKNVASLVDAFNQYNTSVNDKYHLLIVGRKAWNATDSLKKIAKSTHVHHLEHIEEDLPNIMAASEALAYISLFEGFGIPILEGMMSEVPVITSKDSSMSEVGGDAVHLVDPLNISDITSGIKKVLEDKSYSDALVSKGKQRTKEFNWDKTTSIISTKLFSL